MDNFLIKHEELTILVASLPRARARWQYLNKIRPISSRSDVDKAYGVYVAIMHQIKKLVKEM